MLIKLALIISVILQFAAAFIALSLIRRTRANIAWWLISGGFLLMAIRRVFELLQVYDSESRLIASLLSSWTGVLISIMMLLSLAFIKRIFNLQKQLDNFRKHNESKVLSAILKTEEHERQHFAKELHDGLGPLLSSVKMAISASRYRDKTENPLLDKAESLIDESVTTLKDISNKLSPHILLNFGLYKALKSFIARTQITGNPIVHFSSNLGDSRFAFNIEVILYRVVCELINNTLKHASARNIYIDLNKTANNIYLKYMDDGIGFDDSILKTDQTGMGIANIVSRIKSMNGAFGMHSSPGDGLVVNISVSTIETPTETHKKFVL